MRTMALAFGLGDIPDPPDPRDFLWRAVVRPEPMKLPRAFRVRTCGPVLDQGVLPRCVAFATATIKMVDEYRERKVWYSFDEAWLYDLCKQHDGKPTREGTNLRTALKLVQKQGYVARGTYQRAKHLPGRKRTFTLKNYVRVESTRQIKEAVKTVGPVAFGIKVDDGIYRPVAGRVPEPSGKPFGGHAMVISGWDDDLGAFRIKNSWGYDWGDRGFAWLPYTHFDAYKWNAWKTVDVLGEPV
jgi:C1A family cysteine protease